MDKGAVKNLEQIQETDLDGGTPRYVTILLVAFGGAAVVFSVLALGGRRGAPAATKADPLSDLVTQTGKPAAQAPDLGARDVTFPSILSDEAAPTTALVAVRPHAAAPEPAADARPLSPPPATERLPVVPLPAAHVLEATPVVTRPRDALTKAATEAAQVSSAPEPAAPKGHEGGYQLQVSSFRSQSEAEQFAAQLRARAHKAYVVEARVPNRGTWYRVRVGPFPTQVAAASYRAGFEGKEHVVPFVVPPGTK